MAANIKLQPAPVQKRIQLNKQQTLVDPSSIDTLWRGWFDQTTGVIQSLSNAINNSVVTNNSAWGFANAALRSTNGIINYQTQRLLNNVAYASGTVTVGAGNTGLYLIGASAAIGYNGGFSGANATIEIFFNGAGTGYKCNWTENNNTTEHGTIAVFGLIESTSASDTFGIQFSTSANGSCFAGQGTFIGRLVGT